MRKYIECVVEMLGNTFQQVQAPQTTQCAAHTIEVGMRAAATAANGQY